MALAKEDMYTRVLCSQNSIGILYFRDEGNTRLLVLKPHNLREGKKKRKKKMMTTRLKHGDSCPAIRATVDGQLGIFCSLSIGLTIRLWRNIPIHTWEKKKKRLKAPDLTA